MKEKENEQEDTRYYKKILISLILTALLVVIVISLSFTAYLNAKNIREKNRTVRDIQNGDISIKDKDKNNDDKNKKSIIGDKSSTKDGSGISNGSTNSKYSNSSNSSTRNNSNSSRGIFSWWDWITGHKTSGNNGNSTSGTSSGSNSGNSGGSSSGGSSVSGDTSRISMTYTEATNGISITNAMPTKDEIGMRQIGEGEYFDFTVKTDLSGGMQAIYEIAAIKNNSSTVQDNFIRLYLEEEKNGTYVKSINPTAFIPISSQTNVGSPAGSMVLKRVDCNSSGTYNYRLKMWLSEDATIDTQKSYSVRINVYGAKK